MKVCQLGKTCFQRQSCMFERCCWPRRHPRCKQQVPDVVFYLGRMESALITWNCIVIRSVRVTQPSLGNSYYVSCCVVLVTFQIPSASASAKIKHYRMSLWGCDQTCKPVSKTAEFGPVISICSSLLELVHQQQFYFDKPESLGFYITFTQLVDFAFREYYETEVPYQYDKLFPQSSALLML